MHILVDCDGVLAEFSAHLLRLLGSDLKLAELTVWNIFAPLSDRQREAAYTLLDGTRFWRSQPEMEGARAGVEALRADGHDITCVTSPWYACERWERVRREWLQDHFGIAPDDVIIAAKKQYLQGDVFIDDKPGHVRAWAAVNPSGIALLYDHACNVEEGKGLARTAWDSTRPEVKTPLQWIAARSG